MPQRALIERRRNSQLRKARLSPAGPAAGIAIRVAALSRDNDKVGRRGANTASLRGRLKLDLQMLVKEAV